MEKGRDQFIFCAGASLEMSIAFSGGFVAQWMLMQSIVAGMALGGMFVAASFKMPCVGDS